MKYQVYFHLILDTLDDLDWNEEKKDYVPSGHRIFGEEEIALLINPWLTVHQYDFDVNEEGQITCITFEAWFEFEAKDDKEAIKIGLDKAAEEGYDWLTDDISYIIQKNNQERIVRNIKEK